MYVEGSTSIGDLKLMLLAAISIDPISHTIGYDIDCGDTLTCFHPMFYPTLNTELGHITFAGTRLPDDLKYSNILCSLTRSLHYTDKPTILLGCASFAKTEIMIVQNDEMHNIVMHINFKPNHIIATVTSDHHESQS